VNGLNGMCRTRWEQGMGEGGVALGRGGAEFP